MSKLSTFFMILVLALGLLAPTTTASSQGFTSASSASEPFCGDTTTVDLLRNSNKKLVSGTVMVANGETTLFVTYTPASPWTLVQTDLAVAASLADIPVTNKGNPKVDQFPYRSSHDGITTYTYEIPLSDLGVGAGDDLVIAAHADLRKTGSTKTEGAWSDGEEFVQGKRSWGMYFTYTIQSCNEPPIAVNDAYSVDEDNMLNVAAPGVLANDTDPESDPLTAVLVSSPTNGALTLNADGSLTYTPDANFNGSDSFTYKANDGSSDSNVATVNITVNPVNDAPIAVDDAYNTDEDTALNIATPGVLANDADVEVDPLAAILVSGPAHGSLTLNPDGSFIYTPALNYNGSDSFTYKANDGALDSNIATVNITVNPVNDAPVATDDSYNTIEDTVLNVPAPGVLSNDTDVDGDSLSAILVSGPAHGTLTLNPDGSFTYTPNVDYNGSDSFTYKANDGQADSNVATVSITILPPNAAPVANDQTVSTNEDTLLPITLSGTDSDGDSLTFTIVDNPANGSLGSLGSVDCLSNPGTCTVDIDYTPDADFNGSDSFTFKANDGTQDSNTATVDITVEPVNDAPSFTSGGNVTVDEDSGAYSAAWATGISAGPSDESGQTLSFNIPGNSNPSLFSVAPAIAPDGTLSFTLAANANGTASLSVTLQDDGGIANGGVDTSAPVNFDIIVNGVNDGPVNTVPGAQAVDEDTDLVFSTANSNALSVADADAGSGNIQVTVSALNGTITPALGSGATIGGSGTSSATITGTLTQVNAALDGLKYKGNANFNSTRGSETLTLLTDDQGNTGSGGALTDTDTVDITVNAVNDAPTALAKNFNAQANMKITGLTGLLTGATDPDTGDSGYTATFTVGTVSATTPAGGTISNLNTATGSFDFDPPPGATGNVTFTYTVCDSGNPAPSACSAPATVTVSVAGPVIWFVNPAAGVNGDGRLSTPFNSLASAAAVDASGHRIFVYAGTTPTASITLNTDEWLIGQGVTGTTFDALFSITPPAETIARPSINGTRPVIQGNVAMATSDVVRGLNIQPASGTAGLTASGTTSLTVNEVSVSTANATAVGLTNSDGTFSFTRIDANGGSNGIVWNNASPATGSFTVIGTGSAGSGGTIQNMTSYGISLNNARSVSLDRMIIQNIGRNGIDGTGVVNFTFTNSTISNTGTAGAGQYEEALIGFNNSASFTENNLSGNVTITNNVLSQPRRNGIDIQTWSGTIANLVISGNTISGGTTTANILHAILVLAQGSAGTNASITTGQIQNNTITGFRFFSGEIFIGGSGIFVGGGNPSNAATTTLGTVANPIEISSNDVDNVGSNAIAVSFNGLNGISHFNIHNNGTPANPMSNMEGLGISVFFGGNGTFSALVNNNAIDNNGPTVNAGSAGIGVQLDDSPSGLANATGIANITVNNNTITNPDGFGIRGIVRASNGTLNLKIQNNSVGIPSAANRNAIRVDSGSATGNTTLCLNMTGNTGIGGGNLTGSGVNAGIGVRKQGTVSNVNFFGINGITTNPSNAQVQAYLASLNPTTGVDIISGSAYMTCTLP